MVPVNLQCVTYCQCLYEPRIYCAPFLKYLDNKYGNFRCIATSGHRSRQWFSAVITIAFNTPAYQNINKIGQCVAELLIRHFLRLVFGVKLNCTKFGKNGDQSSMLPTFIWISDTFLR